MNIHHLKCQLDVDAIWVALRGIPYKHRTEKVVRAIITAYIGGGMDAKLEPSKFDQSVKCFVNYYCE